MNDLNFNDTALGKKVVIQEGMLIKPPKHLCPTHGVTKDGCVSLWDGGKLEGDYCMTCYKDMIRKFCQPVTPV